MLYKYLISTLVVFLMLISSCSKKETEPAKESQKNDSSKIESKDSSLAENGNVQEISDRLDTEKIASAESMKAPLKGRVLSLHNVLEENYLSVSVEKAREFASRGWQLVFFVGEGSKGIPYFVYNSDGTIATKQLAEFAEKKSIEIKGKVIVFDDIHMIIADYIK